LVGIRASFLREHGEHLLDLFVVDDLAQADTVGVVGRHMRVRSP